MIRTVREISEMLANQAEDVCRHLMPSGKRNGAEWETGSTGGEAGKSCKVRLTGDRAGRWCDFASGSESGDLIDLWAVTRGVRLPDAIQEAKKWLGVHEPRMEPQQRKTYAKPDHKKARKISETAIDYLVNKRGLTRETLAAFRVAEKADGKSYALTSFSPEGALVGIKYIGIERDANGKKIVSVEPNCAPSLYGWQAFQGGRVVAITEGEIDAMTMHQYGMSALSVPFGAGKGNKNEWIDYEWDNLAQFETIYLCYDNDEAGQSCVEEIVRRLGPHRCRIVSLPHKDANECLMQGVDGATIGECVMASKYLSPGEIRSPAEFRLKVINYFHPKEEHEPGFFPSIFNRKVGLRPGEVTVWTGCNSHGKSVMLGQIMLSAAIVGQPCAIASMEMKPEQTLVRMLKQLWVKSKITVGEVNQALDWMTGKIWIYDLMGNVATAKLLELVEFSMRRHRVQHFVIDSLMKCDVGGEDYDGQRKFLNQIATFAKTHDCHIHVVAHPRKHDEDKPIGRISISGSGDISNQADNVVSVWRNKAKERGEKTWTDSDSVVLCDKQRETGWEGYIDLEFAKTSEQFIKKGGHPVKLWEWAQLTPEDSLPTSPIPHDAHLQSPHND